MSREDDLVMRAAREIEARMAHTMHMAIVSRQEIVADIIRRVVVEPMEKANAEAVKALGLE